MPASRALIALATALALSATSAFREAAAAPSSGAKPPLVVIVASGSSLTDLSRAQLRRIFLGEPTVLGGLRMIPVNHPPSDPVRTSFDALALGLSPDAAGRYWVDRRIRGQGLPPRAIAGTALIREVVAKLPGGIAYVSAEQVGPSVRALLVDGIRHDDPRYPLAEE